MKQITLVNKNFISGGSKGERERRAPPWGLISFNFMQFLRKFGVCCMLAPPGELAPPPRGNPGSATVY